MSLPSHSHGVSDGPVGCGLTRGHPVTPGDGSGTCCLSQPHMHLEEPQLSEQQPPLGPGSQLWDDIPMFAASQAIFLGLVLRSLSVGCLLMTRPIGPSSFHGLPISPPPTGPPSTTQCVVTTGPEGKVLAPGQR